MKGGGTDEQTIIDILTHRTYEQRDWIRNAFYKNYDDNLRVWLSDEVSGVFGTIIDALMYPPTVVLASHLQWALEGAGTNEQTLIDILVPMTTTEKTQVKSTFKAISGYSLRYYVKDDTQDLGNSKSDNFIGMFLDASSHLYIRVCPSIYLSVYPSVSYQ